MSSEGASVFPPTIFNPSDEVTREVASSVGTPCYLTDEKTVRERIRLVASMPTPFGIKPRYAMKAYSIKAVLKIFLESGFGIDASSGFEAKRAMLAGFAPKDIALTAQELPDFFVELLEQGIDFNACSLNQLRQVGEIFKNNSKLKRSIGVRINPGFGSGHSQRTHVAGPAAGFGIWHEHVPEVLSIAKEYGIEFCRVHSHIGAGAKSEDWERAALTMLDIVGKFSGVTSLGLGGGFKVRRVAEDIEADLQGIGNRVSEAMRVRAHETGLEYELEIEPGTFLAAPIAAIISRIIDVIDTGKDGYRFIKLDTGMTEITRPAMYGSQHPIRFVPANGSLGPDNEFLVIGHCCESGDLLTPEVGNPENLSPRKLPTPKVGDLAIIGGAGAYCYGMSALNYNSFPEAPHAMLTSSGKVVLTKKRQTLEQILYNEV